MNFHIGMKVVCVDASPAFGKTRIDCPLTEGKIYTVLGIETREKFKFVNLRVDGDRRHWAHVRFRPIVERSTDISIFTAMLTPKKTRVRA